MSKTVSIIGAIALFLIGIGLLCFGLLYVWASFEPGAPGSWIVIGLITSLFGLLTLGGGVAVLVIGSRRAAAAAGESVTLKVDLPGNVGMDTLKCRSCGGTLKSENIKMIAGAPVVTCPFCDTTYQLTEEPKW